MFNHLLTRRRRFSLATGALIVGAMVATSHAENQATEIYDSLILRGAICTIDIDGSDITVCAGQTRTYSAVVTCADGYERSDFDPTWLLDGSPVGTGESIDLSIPTPGTYVLEANCGSCTDQIVVEVSDCLTQPRLDAAFSDDDTEESVGIFMQPNISIVSQLNFQQLKFHMRPFTLDKDASLGSGTMSVESAGDASLQFFTPSGVAIAQPATYDVSELPVTFYVNAVNHGTSTITASYTASAGRGTPTTDAVLVRVGPFPGIGGEIIGEYPNFHYVDSFNSNDQIRGALDGPRHAERDGLQYRAYVVEHKTAAGWAGDNTLADVTGGFETATFSDASTQANIVTLWAAGLDSGPLIHKSYDIVYDFGMDGTLDAGDIIDGLSFGEEAGAYVVKDLTAAGPYTPVESTYSGGTWLGQNLFYPSEIGTGDLTNVPIIIMSHGNGHQYTWYDYLGTHYASHGFVFMSHQNNTGPGIETASTTTLTNTNYLLGNLGTIAGGALDGNVNLDRVIWSGHSRGGEGVVRAYDRLFDGETYPNFDISQIVLVSSIAPTVFLTAGVSDPHDVTYHVIGAAGDGDVSGAANCAVCQYFRLHDRAEATAMTMYVHGTDHNDYNCCGFNDYTGPPADQIGRDEAQKIARSYYLALAETYGNDSPAVKEYLTRMYDDLKPIGVLPTAIVALTYTERATAANFVIDDYETQPADGTSSSGGTVTYDVSNLFEGILGDADSTYGWLESDPMNGMTYHSGGGDIAFGAIWDYTVGQTRYVEYEVVPGARDVRDMAFVSFRACQQTHHPETVALDDYHSFSVTLRDGSGTSSSIHFGGWGHLTPLFQRSGGWLNEMNTVRARVSEFETNGSGIDLSDVVAVRLEFGAAFGSDRGRIGIDDVQFTAE